MAQSMNLFNPEPEERQSEQFVDGRVEAIFFEGNDSFYKVVLIKVSETSLNWDEDEIVVTGNFGNLTEDGSYHFIGKIVTHPRYGTQFQASNYSRLMVNTENGIVKYLSSDEFPGIGEKTATKIANALGADALAQISQNPQILEGLGISKKLQNVIVDNIDTGSNVDQIIIGLNSYGFSSQLADKIYQKYREDALKIIQENPYQLIEDIDGISFKKADAIAAELGIDVDASQRIEAALLFALTQISQKNGDTYTTSGPLLLETTNVLNESRPGVVNGDQLAAALIELARSKRVVGDDDRIYLSRLYWAERQIAEHLNRLLKNQADDDSKYSDKAIAKKMRVVEKQADILYDESQEKAITQALQSSVFILTGGPGTGKTTIINGIVHTFAKLNDYSLDVNSYKDKPFPIVLVAPTGRAAKHMSESTGLPASTIHRLLGLNGSESADFEGVKDIEGQLLIIDEMSMVDTDLFKTLLRALPNHMQLILVGDQDQLPSVGPGQVFHDLIQSQCLPKIELSQIYRQEAGSSITQLAHAIHEGHLPADFLTNQADRSFIQCNENQVASVVKQVVERSNQKFDLMDMQVLAPMYRGRAGINQLNEVIQNTSNPVIDAQNTVTIKQQQYRVGDKVLQLINSPEENVFNGDIGEIITIEKPKGATTANKVVVAFDSTEVTYDRSNWNQFTLAYCTSIHKAQGSEFKLVILPLVKGYTKMLKRNLLYTAVTRASDFLILIGDPAAYQMCVESESVNRQTTLVLRLEDTLSSNKTQEKVSTVAIEKVTEKAKSTQSVTKTIPTVTPNSVESSSATVLTMQLIQGEKIDPMIGMAGISPTDF